jgi:hypothetical protein
MENFSNFFNDSNLHKEINDDELIKLANDNTYDILMGKITMNELFNKDIDVPLLVNPSEKVISNTTKLEILDGMLEYYIEEEEYEKCSKLLELKNKL